MSLFFQLFAGVPMSEVDTFPLVPLGRWLFPIGIYLLIMGFQLGMDRRNRRFAIIRYGCIQKWWKYHFFKNLLNGVYVAVVLLVLFKIIDLIVLQMFTQNLKEILVIGGLWTVHAMTISALFLFMENLQIKKMIPAAILLLEGLTFLTGFRFREISQFMFGSWGMYVQSKLHDEIYGFSIISVILVQTIITIICYKLGSYLLKGREMEGD